MFIIPLSPALFANWLLAFNKRCHRRHRLRRRWWCCPLRRHRRRRRCIGDRGGRLHGRVIVGGGGALATAVDVSTNAAVAATNDDAVGAVVPPSSNNDEDAYVGASVAFEGVCVSAFADGAGESASASALLPPCCRRCDVLRRRASRCRHHR